MPICDAHGTECTWSARAGKWKCKACPDGVALKWYYTLADADEAMRDVQELLDSINANTEVQDEEQ